jgi:hypothetical protein
MLCERPPEALYFPLMSRSAKSARPHDDVEQRGHVTSRGFDLIRERPS